MDISLQTVLSELKQITAEMSKGQGYLYDCECKVADKEAECERAYNLAFINNTGSVADRTAIAKLESVELRLEADLAKAEYNRVRTKLKHLELQQMSAQTAARLLETELRVLK